MAGSVQYLSLVHSTIKVVYRVSQQGCQRSCLLLLLLSICQPAAASDRMSRPGGNPTGGNGRAGNNSRPQMPQLQANNGTRPAGPVNRPSISSSKPSKPAPRPSIGMPSVDQRPNGNLARPNLPSLQQRPQTRPGAGSNKLPNNKLPSVGTRPTPLPGGRPDLTRPVPGRPDLTRPLPGQVTRPAPLPGRPVRPEIQPTKPGRPTIGGLPRPTPLPWPAIDRPGPGTKPGRPTTKPSPPIIGGPHPGRPLPDRPDPNRPGRPYPNRPSPHRPSWGNGNSNNWWNQPGHGHWGNTWHDHHVHHHHHHWYHGSWYDHGGSWWNVPIAVGYSQWGWNSLMFRSGYAYYVNPYYVRPNNTTIIYDYSRPIVVASNPSDEFSLSAAQAAAEQRGLARFDEAIALFRNGQYEQARRAADQTVQLRPDDPLAHEFRALTLFATRDYDQAASALNALLAVAPAWDWTTMSGLYGKNDYERQLRELQRHCRNKPRDTGARFVLAYHLLICDQREEASRALEYVVKAQPKDRVARRLLASLQPQDQQELAAESAEADDTSDGGLTNLSGSWQARRDDGVTIRLAISDNGKFTWIADDTSGPMQIQGNYVISDELLILNSGGNDAMMGNVRPAGANAFHFVVVGGDPGDPGLKFVRTR